MRLVVLELQEVLTTGACEAVDSHDQFYVIHRGLGGQRADWLVQVVLLSTR